LADAKDPEARASGREGKMQITRRMRGIRSVAVLAAAGFALGGCVGWDRVFPRGGDNTGQHPSAIAPSCWSSDHQALERALWRRR
jgi:hypothetical protein